MRYVVSGAFIVVAMIHLLPLVGVTGSAKLRELYGVTLEDRTVVILMRHRAVLFGVLGGFLLAAAFKPELWPMAFVAATVSVSSFLFLARARNDRNAKVNRVFWVDVVAAVCLFVGALAYGLGG